MTQTEIVMLWNSGSNKCNVLILYDDHSTHVNTVFEHLRSFSIFSRHQFFYAVATNDADCNTNLSIFDAIIIHYSVRLSTEDHISQSYADTVKNYAGLKILFIQDEYDNTETARRWIENLDIHIVFTCVSEKYLEKVYSSSRFPKVEFIKTLTGYVPIALESYASPKPHAERTYLIGYRGRALPYWYGNLGQEKVIIGQRLRQICTDRGIVASIEWQEHQRIYGEQWYTFLEDCRATLGTESGANVFDATGSIRRGIEAALKANPAMTYEEIHQQYLAEHEGKVIMNQISPKIFEAIALKTALILFEGDYSGIIQPGVHYIPLKKDFSNVDEVLKMVQDEDYVNALVNRAYTEVIQSGKYSYQKFVEGVDRLIAQRVTHRAPMVLVTGLIGGQPLSNGSLQLPEIHASSAIRALPTSAPLVAGRLTVVHKSPVGPVRWGRLQGMREIFVTIKPVMAAKLCTYPRLFRVTRALYHVGLARPQRSVRTLWRRARARWQRVPHSRSSR